MIVEAARLGHRRDAPALPRDDRAEQVGAGRRGGARGASRSMRRNSRAWSAAVSCASAQLPTSAKRVMCAARATLQSPAPPTRAVDGARGVVVGDRDHRPQQRPLGRRSGGGRAPSRTTASASIALTTLAEWKRRSTLHAADRAARPQRRRSATVPARRRAQSRASSIPPRDQPRLAIGVATAHGRGLGDPRDGGASATRGRDGRQQAAASDARACREANQRRGGTPPRSQPPARRPSACIASRSAGYSDA